MGKRIDKGLRALVGGLGNMVVAGLVVTGAATFCWVLTTAIAGTVAGVLGQLVSQTGLAIAGKVLTESALGGVTAVGIFGAMGAVGGFINGTYEKYSELTSIENAEKRAAREKSPQQEKDNTKEKSYEISKSDLDIDKTNANINLNASKDNKIVSESYTNQEQKQEMMHELDTRKEQLQIENEKSHQALARQNGDESKKEISEEIGKAKVELKNIGEETKRAKEEPSNMNIRL